MIISAINHSYMYDIENIAEIFFPYEKIRVISELPSVKEDISVVTEINNGVITVEASVYGRCRKEAVQTDKKEDEANALSVLFYNVLCTVLNVRYPWGLLYGVRPARFMHSLIDSYGEEKADSVFKNKYLVSDNKLSLVKEVVRNENRIIKLSSDSSFSLYVSIPFCPSRCTYCSFVSHSIEQAAKLIDDYVELLCLEIKETAAYAKRHALKLETVYFGGGTPTTLSKENLIRLFSAVAESFDLSSLREYTVEAGRPDTVTEEKLFALKNAGVSRISINPQSFNNNVLESIGRRHSAEQAVSAFELARNCGFDNINMDFIAGLPNDNLQSFRSSIDRAIFLGAESITVHTLCLKTGAYMVTRNDANGASDKNLASEMVDYSRSALSGAGYIPYYMYRQGKSVGNLENVGWSRKGRECLYNVFMMDETHSVFAVGAGAVTMLKNFKNGKIERIYNYKYPYEYIERFDELLRRKQKIDRFYGEL